MENNGLISLKTAKLAYEAGYPQDDYPVSYFIGSSVDGIKYIAPPIDTLVKWVKKTFNATIQIEKQRDYESVNSHYYSPKVRIGDMPFRGCGVAYDDKKSAIEYGLQDILRTINAKKQQ